MDGTYQTNLNYRTNRDTFMLGNEGFRQTVYFDTVGVPTIGKGIALVVPPNKYISNATVHKENLNALAQELGMASAEYLAIKAFAERVAMVISETPSPNYGSGKKGAVCQAQVRGISVPEIRAGRRVC